VIGTTKPNKQLDSSKNLLVRLQTQTHPERYECSEGDGGEEVPCERVTAGCDAPEILQAAEGVFDEMAAFATPCIVADRALAS
jgi:hypothetical protein